MGMDWTDEENDLIVASYFAMLANELRRQRYKKVDYRRALLPGLNGRSDGAAEYKYGNISAILAELGKPWIAGYKPAPNFQLPLVDAVARWLAAHPEWVNHASPTLALPSHPEAVLIELVPPPTRSSRPLRAEREGLLRIATKFDFAGRDERNRMLGRAGEERVLALERAALRAKGRDDLARKVRWVSDEDGDGAGYDIASFTPDGHARLIEVKTTNGWERTPFYISRNELAAAEAHRAEWRLLRLWNFSRQPKAFELHPPLDAHVTLTATTYIAAFQRDI